MSTRQTVLKSQLDTARPVLERLGAAISPVFLGIVTTAGQPITVISSTHMADADALASLSASSFAATRQLAMMMEDPEFTIMLYEGSELNITIAQITQDILLVMCFRNSSEIGRVRLLTGRAVAALSKAFGPEKGVVESGKREVTHQASEMAETVDEILSSEGDTIGTD